MGLYPNPAAPPDSNMHPSQPLGHPGSLYTAQNPVVSATPSMVGPSHVPQGMVGEHGAARPEPGARTGSHPAVQQPFQPRGVLSLCIYLGKGSMNPVAGCGCSV